ncbi:MAG: hypothetical protein IM589_00480, partial [Cytophagales bacterium]|nr:hypothetical protein [Cytophagales bacterium]
LARQDNVDDDYKDYYKVIFFQHFLNLTLKDEILRKEMLGFIPRGIEAAFENDMIKSTQDFTATLVNYGLAGYTNEINQFFNGLSRSEYKNFEEVYKVLFESLKSKKNRFDLWDIISASPGNGIANINYGILLKEKYQHETLTESESLSLQELERIIVLEQQGKLPKQQMQEAQKKQE